MFVEDLKAGFYDLLIGKRVVIFVNYDIDAICSYKILQHLFKYDEILFTMVPVQGIQDLRRAFEETPNENVVVLINCGGTLDIVERLEPDPDVVFFIVDSHRPTDVCNIYSQSQIRLLRRVDEDENIPDFGEIFRDDEDESEPEDSEDEEGRRDLEATLMKRRERREWESRRDKAMFEYCSFSYYGRASAAVLFELAWKLSKDNLELLWWGVVGLTEQHLLGKVEPHRFLLEAGTLQSHMLRLSHKQDTSDQGSTLKISFDKDLQLALYRHWTVESSIKFTRHTACKLRIWSLKGERLLHQLLADMGIPLAQSKQKFGAMDLELRHEFCEKLESQAQKYELGEISAASFTLQFGYRQRFSAADTVYALLALLENCDVGRTPRTNFNEALDALNRTRHELLESGIERAKQLLDQIFQFVRSTVNMRLVASTGPFLFLVVQEGLMSHGQLVRPHCMALLTRFMLEAYVVHNGYNQRVAKKPLVVSVPYTEGLRLLFGVPPHGDGPKNLFGQAFEQAAERSQVEAQADLFDTSYIIIKKDDQERFFDALTTLLK